MTNVYDSGGNLASAYITDLNGKLYEALLYFPFGEGWIEENTNVQRTPYAFTAKELDEETGLYYFGARYYDPRTSVWQSPDPALGRYLPNPGRNRGGVLPSNGIFDPANLNLYSYAGLNPTGYIDPQGLAKDVPEITVVGRTVEFRRFQNLEHGTLKDVNAIVLHRTDTATGQAVLNAYARQKTGAHFLITEDGKIIQTASTTKQTWHVGNIRARCAQEASCSGAEQTAINKILAQSKTYGQRIKELSDREIANKDYPDRYPTNQDSIGIEVVGRDYTTATPEQLSAVKALVEALQDKYGLGDADVYAHGTISYKDPQEGSNLGY